MFEKGDKVIINQNSEFKDGGVEITLHKQLELEVSYDNGKGYVLVGVPGITIWLQSWRLEKVK